MAPSETDRMNDSIKGLEIRKLPGNWFGEHFRTWREQLNVRGKNIFRSAATDIFQVGR